MRIRAQERAEVAAHVHDSVLHTLTLIQRNADDAGEVRRLARAQERELRNWLYKPEGTGKDEDEEPDTLAEAVKQTAAEVEDKHGVPIEVVVVGDCPLDERLTAQMQAAREAMVNAAKYGGEGGAGAGLRRGRGADGLRVRTGPRARASTSTRYPTTAWAYENRSSAGCSATAARHGCASVPDGGTEVELEMERAANADDRRGRWTTGARPATGGRPAGTRRGAGSVARRRPPDVPHGQCRPRSGRDRPHRASRSSARPPTSTRRSRSSRATRPEVVLLDVHLPGGGGVEVLRRCAPLMAAPRTRCGSWRCPCRTRPRTSSASSGAVRAATSPRRSPAPTWSTRSSGSRTGDAVFSPRLAGFVLDAFASTDAPPVDEDLDRLTQREREVLRLIARGYAYKEIAKQLFISVKTVESHVSAVLRKLQLSNRHELTRWATARRLV